MWQGKEQHTAVEERACPRARCPDKHVAGSLSPADTAEDAGCYRPAGLEEPDTAAAAGTGSARAGSRSGEDVGSEE